MSLVDYFTLIVAFLAVSFGLGLPLARRLLADATERLCAAPVIGLSLSFVVTFMLFVTHTPMQWFALAPVAGAIGFWWERKTISQFWTNHDARRVLLGWIIVGAWTQFLAMTVVSFGGGGWGGDWLEHHQRAIFFREHVPLQFLFIGDYLLPARPPLVNVVTAGFQAISTPVYACDQVIIGLWSSLVFLPAALFCRRAGGTDVSVAILVGLILLNPSFLQNSTFAWTKLPTAFFVLAGAHFLFGSLEKARRPNYFFLATIALTAALLSHYSAGLFCAVLVFWWLAWRAKQRQFTSLLSEIWIGLAIVLPLLGLWFGWSVAAYGINDTLLSNSTAIEAGPPNFSAQLGKVASNIRDTLVPHPFREVDYSLIRQASSLGWFRDYFFLIAQVNLFGLMGTGGAIALLCALWRAPRLQYQNSSPLQLKWIWFAVVACVLLGIAVHGAADEWGLAHICLQPLALLALATLAAKYRSIGRIGITVLAVGLIWDAMINIGLHYWLQAQPPRPEWLGTRDLLGVYEHYGVVAFNACLKDITLVRFLGDTMPVRGLFAPFIVILGAILAWRRSILTSTPQTPTIS